MIRTVRSLALLTLTVFALLGIVVAGCAAPSTTDQRAQVLVRGVHPACDIDWCAA